MTQWWRRLTSTARECTRRFVDFSISCIPAADSTNDVEQRYDGELFMGRWICKGRQECGGMQNSVSVNII